MLQTIQPQTQCEKTLFRKARIKTGARVMLNGSVYVWPNLPGGDASIVFDAKPADFLGLPLSTVSSELFADNFGSVKEGENFGDGHLFIQTEELVFLD